MASVDSNGRITGNKAGTATNQQIDPWE
nr:hypothetical protein [uncultured Anaerostipes sp.]